MPGTSLTESPLRELASRVCDRAGITVYHPSAHAASWGAQWHDTPRAA